MKRILFLLSILSLFAYGCNRDQQEPAGGGMGMEEEQQRPADVEALPENEMETVEPSMQEDMEMDPAMQEEENRYEDLDSQKMEDDMDSSMGSGTDTAPEAEPTDATGIEQ